MARLLPQSLERTMETPAQVQIALKLLWGSFALGLVHVVSLALFDESSWESAAFLITIVAVTSAAYAALIVYAGKRHNWARVVLLLAAIASVALFLFPADEPEPLWSTALILVSSLLEIAAMFWLFSRVGNEWYREGPQSAF